MIVTLYLAALFLAAGTTGVYLQQILGTQGYAPNFAARLMLAGGLACAYLAAQFLYLAVLRALKPTESRAFYLCDGASQAGALALLPGLLHWRIAWPDPFFARVEPLIFLGAFGAVHLFFKLMAFYAALVGRPGARTPALAWGVACALCAGFAFGGLGQWLGKMQADQPEVSAEVAPLEADGAFASGRALPESAWCDVEFGASAGDGVSLLWAYPPSEKPPADGEQIYIYVRLSGQESSSQWQPLRLSPKGWTELRLPSDRVPTDTKRCRVAWRADKPAPWEKLTGLRPTIASKRALLCAGPWAVAERKENRPLNYVFVAIDGLSSRHVSAFGYERATTPGLDALAAAGQAFPFAYTPAPETGAGCMTLLTGASPLRHHYLGDKAGPLPDSVSMAPVFFSGKHYATAAFVECGEQADSPLAYGKGFERGFALYDGAYISDAQASGASPSSVDAKGEEGAVPSGQAPLAGSAATLDRARRWIDMHGDAPFFVFVRLRELGDMHLRERNGAQFMPSGEKGLPVDQYDSLLFYLDRHIGAFTKHLRESEARRNTCIVVTAPYGYDFSGAPGNPPAQGLLEDSLQTPVFLYAPGVARSREQAIVGLEDALPTALGLSDLSLPPGKMDGVNLRVAQRTTGAISMAGNPLIVTLRTERWRMYWSTGLTPLGPKAAPLQNGAIQLYRAPNAGRSAWSGDVANINPQATAQLRDILSEYLRQTGGAS